MSHSGKPAGALYFGILKARLFAIAAAVVVAWTTPVNVQSLHRQLGLPSVFALMSKKEIATVRGLKGRTIAVSQIGDPPYNYTNALLAKFGMGPRDVQWIAAGADANARAAALASGRADATLLTPPAYYKVEDAGFKVLANLADHDDIFAATTYLMRKSTVTANPRLPELLIKAHADWIIDLGPGAGHDGGRIVFEGTPADLVAARSTLTGEHLAAFVGNRPKAVPAGAPHPIRARHQRRPH